MTWPQPIYQPAPLGRRIRDMVRVRNRWALAIACVAFVTIVLATTSRVSPPTALHGVRSDGRSPVSHPPRFIPSAEHYAWLSRAAARSYVPLAQAVAPPDGFERVFAPPKSFANWLRHLPAMPEGTPVRTGRKKIVIPAGSPEVAAVVALQPSSDRALAGANMLIRLRGEFAWDRDKAVGLAFHFTSGHRCAWDDWVAGQRPTVQGKQVSFKDSFEPDATRANFCSYLETVFQYGSHYSVLMDSTPVKDGSIAVGDIFLRQGRGGYALIVVDAAAAKDGSLRVLLGEAGTPAQTFHLLRAADGSPWFPLAQGQDIPIRGGRTVRLGDLRRFK